MADVMDAFLRGHQAGQNEIEHQQQLEDNKLRTLVLKHQIAGLQIEDQMRARELAKQNLDLLHGQPAADLPSETVTTPKPYAPSTGAGPAGPGVMTGLPDVVSSLIRGKMGAPDAAPDQGASPTGTPAAPPSFIAAPTAQSTDPTFPATSTQTAAVNIPGVAGLGIPGVSVRPRSAEDLVRQATLAKLAEPYTLGEGARRFIGGQEVARGGSKPVVIPRGGTLTNPDDPNASPILGQPAAPTQAEIALKAAGGDPAKAMGLLKPAQQDPFGAAITAGAAAIPDVQPGQRNEAFLSTLPPGAAGPVKMLVDGKLSVPSGAALRSPYWQGLIQAANKYDPTFDAVNYNARSKTRSAFTSGKEAGQVNALNTVIGHLDTLSQAADKLSNFSSLGPFTTTANEVKNYISQKSGSQNVTNFNVTRKAVADELTRVWRQAGGSEKDIQENLQNLSSANSPEQLHGAIATFGDLLESKLSSLNEQYRQGMGTDKVDILTTGSRETLSRLEKKAGKTAGSLTSNLPSAAAPQAGAGMIEAKDPQGNIHHAPAGTALPAGWTLVK